MSASSASPTRRRRRSAESPAFTILEALEARGAVVNYHDPFIPALPAMRHHAIRLASRPLTAEFLRDQDAVLIVTDHDDVDYEFVVANSRLVVDTRNATAGLDVVGVVGQLDLLDELAGFLVEHVERAVGFVAHIDALAVGEKLMPWPPRCP